MEGFALNNIQNCYVGSTPATAIYLGSNKIWPTTQHDYSQDYLTFTALEDTTFTFSDNALQYSLDNGNTWTTLSANTASPTVTAGNKILWKQTGLTQGTTYPNYGIGTFSATGNFDASGNIMSLHYGDNFINQTDLTGKNYAFNNLFHNNTKLINAKNIILPATTLTNGCYSGMFDNCTSLTTTPELPATTLKYNCYDGMFRYCSSLTTPPELPATTLIDSCYYAMFSGCTSLTTIPELPATTLATNCYKAMFFGCTSLTIILELPATTLADNCYQWMFSDCTSLTTAPELPATTLAEFCYSYMFEGCTSLTTAPELPAATLKYKCYEHMFQNCTNLNYIKMLATDISASDCLSYWVDRVSATGTFVKNAAMTTLPTGISGVPAGWTVRDT